MTNLVECPYKTAGELGITEAEREGLVRLIPQLLSGQIAESDFKMTSWCNCIRYHLNVELGEKAPSTESRSASLHPLFGGGHISGYPEDRCWAGLSYADATPAQGAVAIANFLTHGK